MEHNWGYNVEFPSAAPTSTAASMSSAVEERDAKANSLHLFSSGDQTSPNPDMGLLELDRLMSKQLAREEEVRVTNATLYSLSNSDLL
jgi:hypothetical protein